MQLSFEIPSSKQSMIENKARISREPLVVRGCCQDDYVFYYDEEVGVSVETYSLQAMQKSRAKIFYQKDSKTMKTLSYPKMAFCYGLKFDVCPIQGFGQKTVP